MVEEQVVGEDFTVLLSPDEQGTAIENYERYLKSSIRSSGEMKMMKKMEASSNALYHGNFGTFSTKKISGNNIDGYYVA